MERQTIREILARLSSGGRHEACGWVRTRRESKTFCFVEINDGSCLAGLQVIVDAALPGYADLVPKLTTGTSVCVRGDLVDSPAAGQKYELRAQEVQVFCSAPAEYPLQKKHHTFEYLREIAHLRPRTNSLGAVARLRNALSYAVHAFFQERGFVYVHTPIITASDCEGAGKQFTVTALDVADFPRDQTGKPDYGQDFFGKQARLTVSGQLEGETYAMALGRVYTFGPTFRAEKSNTARHLAEFWMVEPEMAFCELRQDMDLAEEFVRFLVRYALERCGDDLAFFNQRIEPALLSTLENIAANSFERLTYTQAIAILENSGQAFEYPVRWGMDIQSEHERYLVEKTFNKPVILHDYPREIKAFYMKANDDGKTVRAMDVLVPRIGELIGGSEREDRYEILREKIRSLGLREEDYWWYLDLRKFGGAPHAGFGLGFERLLLLVTGMQNIRDVIPYPRYPGNAEF